MESRKTSDNTSATRIVASVFGTLVGLAAIEHGYFETQQGNVKPGSLLFPAIGPAQRFWEYGTEHAMTVIPSLLVTGILAMLVGILIVVWATGFVHKKFGAMVLLLLSVLSFSVGGGFAPIFLAIVGVVAATRIGKPLTWWRTRIPAMLQTALAWLWPWSLIAFVLVFLFSVEIAIFGYPLVSFVGAEGTLSILNNAANIMIGLMLLAPLTAFSYDTKSRLHQNHAIPVTT